MLESHLRIAFVTNAWTVAGGAERVLFTLLAALDRQKFDPVVFCLFDAGDRPSYSEQAEALGITVRRFCATPTVKLRFLRELLRLVCELRKGGFQVVHSSGDMGLGLLAARLAGVPVRVNTIHDASLDRRRVDYWARRIAVRWLATKSVAVSRAVARDLTHRYGASASKIAVVLNGVDDRFLPSTAANKEIVAVRPCAPVRLITVARLAPEKGVDALLNAVGLLAAERDDFELHIVGDGPARDSLRMQARALGIHDRVAFHGHVEDVAAHLQEADVFVLTSRSEGLGIAAIEAMAASLPVVANSVGGLPEVIVDGVTGLLVPPPPGRGAQAEPDPAAVATAIAYILDRPQLAESMGRAGRRRYVDVFSARRFAGQYEALYAARSNCNVAR